MSYKSKPLCVSHNSKYPNNISAETYNIKDNKMENIIYYPNGKIKEKIIRDTKTGEIISKENFDENGTKIINNPITLKPLILSPYSHIKDDKKPKDTHLILKIYTYHMVTIHQ